MFLIGLLFSARHFNTNLMWSAFSFINRLRTTSAGLIVPGDVQQLAVGGTGVHQQIYDLIDGVLIIRAEPEQKVYLQRLRKIFFQLGRAYSSHPYSFGIEGISLTHFSIILFSLITS